MRRPDAGGDPRDPSGALWTVVGLLVAVLLVITAIAMSVRAGRLTYRWKPSRTPLGE
ncbi:MAG TPA: hypothetical protein VH352_24000 [Pseudonocardiaceae bacterium]|jgi:hypothetical protein|nr:hypothetical protein [Pseudonocardiaceae bacterium]